MSSQKRPTDPDPIGSAVRTNVRPRMTPHEIEFMLASVIRSQAVYLAAKDPLSDLTLFNSDEGRYILLWRAAHTALQNSRCSLPPDPATAKEIVASHVAAEVATDITKRVYTPSVEAAVLEEGGLLDAVFSLPMDDAVVERGIDLLSQFVVERKVGDPIRRALAGLSSQETISDPAAIIAVLERHSCDISGIKADPGADAFLPTFESLPPGPKVSTTGIRGMDELLNGGHAAQETYVLLGPTSGGKSALATQIAIEGAKIQSALASEIGPDRAGYWYYFTWELSRDQLRARMYGYEARIHADTFKEDMVTRAMNPLSTSEDLTTLKPYESEPFVNSPGNPVMGERERLRLVNARMSGPNSRLVIVDYSAHAGGSAGFGGTDEIARYLHRQRSRGRKISGIVIDYAGLVVERYCQHQRLRPSDQYILLAGFVNEVRSKISIPYDCASWVLHQLHGSTSKLAPGRVAHHSDARGCQNFADNADFGIQIGNRQMSTGMVQVKATKTRRAPGREDGVLLHFDGRFGRFSDPNQHYVIDPMTHQIVPQDFISSQTAKTPYNPSSGRPNVDPTIGIG